MVVPGGVREKSCRSDVRTKSGYSPTNGRAITRPTAYLPVSTARAMRQQRYSSSTGTTFSCAAIWNTLSAEV